MRGEKVIMNDEVTACENRPKAEIAVEDSRKQRAEWDQTTREERHQRKATGVPTHVSIHAFNYSTKHHLASDVKVPDDRHKETPFLCSRSPQCNVERCGLNKLWGK